MNQILIYKDSKVLPVHIYERIESTGDFFYMVKGYDDGMTIDYDVEELKAKFEEIVQDYILSINSKNIDIANHGIIYSGMLQIEMLIRVVEIIGLIQQADEIGKSVNYISDKSVIKELLQSFKMPLKENLDDQIKIIQSRVSKIENEIAIAQKKIDEQPQESEDKEYDIMQDVIFVERILKITIDVEKTSLYRLGLYKIQAVEEIKRLMKQNTKNGR